MTDTTPNYPLPTAQVQVYVDVFGIELTVEFLLAFGGAELQMGNGNRVHGQLAKLVGVDRALALYEKSQESNRMQTRVPLAKPWVAKCLYAQGASKAAIARKLHVSDVSVRKWLHGINSPRSCDE